MDGDQELKIPVSIRRGFSTPPLQKCLSCCRAVRYHCPFCSPKNFKPAKRNKVKEHLENHLKRAFYIGEYTIHQCGLECRAQPHYHCLYCLDTLTTKINLTNHIPACIQAQQTRGLKLLRSALRRRGGRDAPSNNFVTDGAESRDESIPGSGSQETRSRQSDRPARRHQTVQTDVNKPQDCDEFYFMTLVKLFKKLSPHKKTGVRMSIERLLFEAAFQ